MSVYQALHRFSRTAWKIGETGVYITNVAQEVLSAKVVRIVYGLRWQVELMFKNWKSLLNIHILKGTRPERIKCILYGRLMTITMMTLIASYA